MISTLFVGTAVNARSSKSGDKVKQCPGAKTEVEQQHSSGVETEQAMAEEKMTERKNDPRKSVEVRSDFSSDSISLSGPETGAIKELERTSGDTGIEETSPSQERADSGLLERAQSGDLAAYGELVRKYQSRVITVAYGILRNREDAEDVVQEGFLKAYKNLDSFRGQASFYTWLYRIVFNLSIDLSRKKYRRTETNSGDSLALDQHIARESNFGAGTVSVGSEIVLGRVAGPDEEFGRGELREKISQAMNGLSDDHRAVILLREVDGLSYSEIADVVGCTKGTVMSRLHHARRRLQKVLSEYSPRFSSRVGGAPHEENDEGYGAKDEENRPTVRRGTEGIRSRGK